MAKPKIILGTDAPNTLRTPISFMRWSIINEIKLIRPMPPIKIDKPENTWRPVLEEVYLPELLEQIKILTSRDLSDEGIELVLKPVDLNIFIDQG